MLRYFDTEELLKPSFIKSNGYRYYTDNDFEVIDKIKKLRRYHFSYNEIKKLLCSKLEIDKDIYLKKLEEIKDTASNYDELIFELEEISEVKDSNKYVNTYEVNISKRQSFIALCKKEIVEINDLEVFIEGRFKEIRLSKMKLAGSYFVRFIENNKIDKEKLQIEYCQPVIEFKEFKGFETKKVEAMNCISTIHYGDYDCIESAYDYLCEWTRGNGYKIHGDFAERYFVDSSLTLSNNQFITEVFVPVCK